MEYMEYNEKKNLIKIIKKIVLIIVIGILLNSYLTSPSKAYKALDSYFKKTYGEEFVIKGIGRRRLKDREWYEAGIVFPKSYIGTPKENDRYYWGRGFAEIEAFGFDFDVGDSYGGVLLNESANEFYGKKLKELFGDNVLPVLEIDGEYKFTDFIREYSRVSKTISGGIYIFGRVESDKELFGDNVLPVLEIDGEYKFTDFIREYSRVSKTISGGIYIFGRVESDKDREWYRKQIYEFVQFMKQAGTFEYVDLGVVIWDERVLSEEFRTNEDLRKAILVARNIMDDDKEFINERKRLMKKTDESMKKLTKEEKDKILNNYIKSDIYGVGNRNDEIFVYNKLLGMRIYSPKYIEMKGWNKSKDPDVYEEIKNYDNVSDIKFTFEQY